MSTNHEDAKALAHVKAPTSNLARCYLELHDAKVLPAGCLIVPIDPEAGPEYQLGNWSRRNWEAALRDIETLKYAQRGGRGQRPAAPGDALRSLRQMTIEDLQRANANLIRQAEQQAQEARTQRAIVAEIGELVGCSNDWEMVGAVRTALAAKEDQISALLPGSYYMDPPDGGDVSVIEQLRRMARDAARYRVAVENEKFAICKWDEWDSWRATDLKELDREIDAQKETPK
jgi:hypothetical protein